MTALYQTPFQTVMETFKIILAALVIALIVRTFVIQPYYIPSGSMLETLQIGDRLFVCKFSYGIHIPFVAKELFSTGEPRRGDIIVFPFPDDPGVDYIKRVIGIPGDVLEVRNKQLYRNGEPVQEAYIQNTDPRVENSGRDNMLPRTVPPGKVFVMGDNRDHSQDSRAWGFVDKDTIQGRAVFLFWSSNGLADIKWNRIGTLL